MLGEESRWCGCWCCGLFCGLSLVQHWPHFKERRFLNTVPVCAFICRQSAERKFPQIRECKEGSTKVRRTASTPEQQFIYVGNDGFGETEWKAPTPQQCARLRK